MHSVLLLLLLLLAMALVSSSSATTSESKQADTVTAVALNWRSLELQDSWLTGSVTTRIALGTLPAAELQSVFVDAPEPMMKRVAGTRIEELVVSSSIRLLPGTGIETEARLWFNAADGLPIQLLRIHRGRKVSQKLYRFGSNQVYRQRRQPIDKAERGQTAEHWSDVSETDYSLPNQDAACPVILESSQLLYVLSNQDTILNESGGEFCIFDRKQVYRVRVRLLGRVRLAVDYLQVDANKETRQKHTLQALHIALTSRPLTGAPEDMPPFSFLGLDDDIELLFSEAGRIPLRIQGHVSGYGRVELELKKLAR